MNKVSIALAWTLGVALLFGLAPFSGAAATQRLSGSVPDDIKNLGLRPTGDLPGSQELNLAIGMPLRDRDALERLVANVSDPTSPDFRHYLTQQQFIDAFAPTARDYESMIAFARSNGLEVTATYPNRMLLDVRGSVADIERVLHVRLLVYSHPTEGRTFYAPDVEPSVDLATPVLDIEGLSDYVLPRPLLHPMTVEDRSPGGARPQNGSGPGGGYMGYDFRRAYVPDATLQGTGQKVGLFEIFSGFYQADITYYETLAELPHVPVTPVLVDGYGGGAGVANDEVSLDIEMAISLAPGLSEVRVYEGILPNDILNRMAGDSDVKQLGASWTYPTNSATNQTFLQMASQGQSFYNASGDADAYPGQIPTPADNPNITIVGGTTLTMTDGGGAYVSETVWNWTSSGRDGVGASGGISTRYAIPSWQHDVDMSANQGSTTQRDIPDVGLTADNVYVRYGNGQEGAYGGTSCATPLWAAFTALVNEEAVAKSLPTMGFINPAVYAIGLGPSAACYFHDTATGDNTWSGSPSKFYGVAGYDLCTGWGCPTTALIAGLLGDEDNPCGTAGVSEASPIEAAAPLVRPNPARGTCEVAFDCPAAGRVGISVLDVSGRVVRHLLDGPLTAGKHSIAWDGRDEAGRGLADGVYITRVEAGHLVRIGKVVLAH